METKNAKTGKRKPYKKRNKEYWAKYKGNFHLAGTGRKKGKAAKKKAAAKPIAPAGREFWHRPAKDIPVQRTENGSTLLNVVLFALDQLSIAEKATVFARILGKDQLDEKQLWAVQKLLSN